jgi:hypothetical protein
MKKKLRLGLLAFLAPASTLPIAHMNLGHVWYVTEILSWVGWLVISVVIIAFLVWLLED